METAVQYQQMESEKNQKINKFLIVGLVVTCIALIVVSVVAGIYGSELQKESIKNYCMTTQCLETAAEIALTINSSVDPCEDFYHYVCDGWDDDNSWTNLDYPQYGQFLAVYNNEKDTFLDALFYNTKDDLVGYKSVQKAIAYLGSCHDAESEATEAAVESAWMQTIVNYTAFIDLNNVTADSLTWDEATISAFQSSLNFLTQLGVNPFFKLDAKSTRTPEFEQLIGFWASMYDPDTLDIILNYVFVPAYIELFGLDANSTQYIAGLVGNFTRKLANITTVDDPVYLDPMATLQMTTTASFEDLPNILGSNEILDYTQLVTDLWNVPDDVTIEQFQYLSGDVPFFQALGPLLESVSPLIVQYYVQFAVAYYYLNFNQAYTQTRALDRTDFCFERTKDKFPYVYGYILFNELYDDEAFNLATTLADEIKIDGTKTLIESADWLDDESRAAALKKIDNMEIFIGFPPRIKNGSHLDKHYALAPNMTDDWMENLLSMATYGHIESTARFYGLAHNLTQMWPWIFADPMGFDSWLTDINAFYFPNGNWFTIPVSISQPPFFATGEGYPSSLTYGGLGWIAGHEMSHGFDPDGSLYNWNGTEVSSIFTNYSLDQYNAKMDCFDDQYDAIPVDIVNGSVIYDNGTRTITENVADNAGIRSSWTAWRKYVKKNGKDKLLYGVDLSQEQLFFVGAARIWCQSEVQGSNAGDDDVHSPSYARVTGALQNMPEFAQAFECKKGSKMNPKDRCTVW